jgi:predicted nuclease of predicted toxin-antitoxin system
VRFLIDAQLPSDLAVLLANRGHSAQHVAAFGLIDASDQKIWDHALAIGAVIVNKDADFADKLNLRDGPQVVWIRFGNTRNAELRRRWCRCCHKSWRPWNGGIGWLKSFSGSKPMKGYRELLGSKQCARI